MVMNAGLGSFAAATQSHILWVMNVMPTVAKEDTLSVEFERGFIGIYMTGLRRCSQSCRLRWTNYLRPGIKRGDFTPEDDIRIIKLQKLFGNSWSAIASYLPGRTDSDIKNHWNHKLKKKIQNRDVGGQNVDGASPSEGSNVNAGGATTSSKKRLWVARLQNDIEYVKTALSKVLSSTSPAATSTTCAATPAVSNLPLTVVASSRPPPVSSGLVSFMPSSPNDYKKQALQVISDAQASNFSSSYPCSVENIARLLKNWTEKSSATAHVLIAETESQRKGDVFDNATHQGITNDQGTMNVNKDDDHAKVHYNTTNNSPVPLVVAAPVPFPPAISAVVPEPPPVSVPVPAIVSSAPTATALAPTATAPAPTASAPAPFDGDEEEDNYLPKLCMSLPFDQNVFWPFY